MSRFDRYMLSQLLVLFGFFALILVLIYWVNRAVVLFDTLIADGHSAGVFLEFTALTLPNVIRIVLPVAAFAASVYATNRLSSESELVIMQATGFSNFRLARPALYFGLFVGVLMSILTHVLVPASITRLAERTSEISENITARLLVEGTFLHPSDGITFYIREMTPAGELRGVFLSDARDADETVTYTAKSALLVRTDSGPQLVMFDGLAQTLQNGDQRLFTTSFSDFAYDIGSLIVPEARKRLSVDELSTYDLLFPSEENMAQTRRDEGNFLQEGHNRITQALFCVVASLLGFAALLVGGFSRFGLTKQIVLAITALIFVKLIESAVTAPVRDNAQLWPLMYLPAVFGFGLCLSLLIIASRPRLFRKRAAA
ncbi:LPS export ABC transporter permease LptF [Pseudaestuariivita rosea]|uniref:LPS export ABC transporter permease LptF n=1 Tax=Pseudaestuariivita rosea TaxID=2763263 RepID=UPI001F01105A|nr:LPS export ABC transporter permease LptF [Pseudaestuariivita rosea]